MVKDDQDGAGEGSKWWNMVIDQTGQGGKGGENDYWNLILELNQSRTICALSL